MDDKKKNVLFYTLSSLGAVSLIFVIILMGNSVIHGAREPSDFRKDIDGVINSYLMKNEKDDTVLPDTEVKVEVEDKSTELTKDDSTKDETQDVQVEKDVPQEIERDPNLAYTEDGVKTPFSKKSLEGAGVDVKHLRLQENIWVYTIQEGDTLTRLSAAFGFSVDELANFNKIRDVNLIYADSSLRIPPIIIQEQE